MDPAGCCARMTWVRASESSRPRKCSAISSIGRSPSTVREKTDRTTVNMLRTRRSEEHTSELQSLMRISYAVFCLKKKKRKKEQKHRYIPHTHRTSEHNK